MFQRKKKTRDIDYDMDFPPMGVDFDSWDKRTAESYFNWFLEQIPIRMDYFRKRVSHDLNIEISQLDFSPESLVLIWRWYIRIAVVEKVPEKSKRIARQSQLYETVGEACVQKEQLSLNSLIIQRDIGMYLARVFLKESPELKWTYAHDPPSKKYKNVFNNRPALTGFIGENPPYIFEPIHMVGVQGTAVIEGNAQERDIYDLYKIYSVWFPKG